MGGVVEKERNQGNRFNNDLIKFFFSIKHLFLSLNSFSPHSILSYAYCIFYLPKPIFSNYLHILFERYALYYKTTFHIQKKREVSWEIDPNVINIFPLQTEKSNHGNRHVY